MEINIKEINGTYTGRMRENDRICKPLHKIFQNTGIWSHLVILLKIRHIWSHLVRYSEEIHNGACFFIFVSDRKFHNSMGVRKRTDLNLPRI